MDVQPKNIGDFYKNSLEDYQPEGLDNNWPILESKLAKLKFFKFSLSTFNIYYTSVITATVIAAFFFFNSNSINTVTPSQNSSSDINETINATEDAPSLSEDNPENADASNNVQKNNITAPSNLQTRSGDTTASVKLIHASNSALDSSIITTPKTDTISSSPKTEQPMEVKKKEVKKKIIYVTTQDTLIVTDTIKTKSKKKLWK